MKIQGVAQTENYIKQLFFQKKESKMKTLGFYLHFFIFF
jgi:hypothetical protein